MAWPKMIEVGGIRVPVDSWAEVKEALQEFGSGVTFIGDDLSGHHRDSLSSTAAQPISGLSHGDKTLIEAFLETGDRGMLTSQLSQALGKKGKGVRPALEKWSRKILLVTELNASAFEPVKRFDGRGFRMVEHYRRTAASMIGRQL